MPIDRFYELDSHIFVFIAVSLRYRILQYMGIQKNLQVSGNLVAAQYRYMEPGGPVINLEIVNLKSVFFAINADPASPFLTRYHSSGYCILKLKVTCFITREVLYFRRILI